MLEEKDRNLYNQMMNMVECNKKEIDKIDNPDLKPIAIKTFNSVFGFTKYTNIEINIELDW